MAAVFGWIEYNQNATDTGAPTNLNFGSTNARNLAPSTYPVATGTYSFEKYVKGHFSDSFTRVENIQFWKSAGAYVSGEGVNFTGQVIAYATPTNSASSGANTAIPVAEPGTANVSIGGSLSGSLTSEGSTDFIVLQATVDTSAAAGLVNTKTITLQYDEV